MDRVRRGDIYDALDLVFAWALQRLHSSVKMAHSSMSKGDKTGQVQYTRRDDTKVLDCTIK